MPLNSRPASRPQSNSSPRERSDTPVEEGSRLEKILPKISFDLRHMGQTVMLLGDDVVVTEVDGGLSLMWRTIGDGQFQTRPNISIS